MTGTPHILICDDNTVIHETLGAYLQNEGFTYSSAYDGVEALEKIEESKPDLIILDLMMPKKSGIDVCREVRATSNVPIIMFTAKDEEIDKILGLELGADDYIVKTSSIREVVARIKAVLRRQTEQPVSDSSIIRYKNLEINIGNYDVKVAGQSIRFTPKEVEILYLLAGSPGRVFKREEILSKVWGYDYFGDERAVDTQIKRIRQKFPEDIDDWKITTVYGVGYKFDVAEQGKFVSSAHHPLSRD